jgi:hypothetical protein
VAISLIYVPQVLVSAMSSKLHHKLFFTGPWFIQASVFLPVFFLTAVLLIAVLLTACSDADNETNLVDLHTTASQDVIAISFPDNFSFPVNPTKTVLSINNQYQFSLQGKKSNGVDLITISSHIQWSLSEGAASTIEQNGLFTAGGIAESITLTAKYGTLTESVIIEVSSAKFDRVVQLNDEQKFSIDMCRSQDIKPVGIYVDESGIDEEPRLVDPTVINTIDWFITEQADGSDSQRAYIDPDTKRTLHTLAAGKVIIRAEVTSIYSGIIEKSKPFYQTINDGLNTIKLCNNTDTDFNNCNVSNVTIEKDTSLSLIAVGNYQAEDGSSFNENISRKSKWGISNNLNASIALSADKQQLDITGLIEESTANLAVACGDIEQALDGIDIKQGVVLDSEVSCDGINVNECKDSTVVPVSIDKLSVLSFDVTANEIILSDNVSVTLDERPDEITLVVTANYSNDSSADITDDSSLIYSIIAIDPLTAVIEEKADSRGVYTVLREGIARIQLFYREKTFKVVVVVPL